MSGREAPRRLTGRHRPWVRYARPGGGAESGSAPATALAVGPRAAVLLLAVRPEVGAPLDLEFLLYRAGRAKLVRARVVYVGPHAAGTWEVVCAFAEPLTAAELRAVLGEDPAD